ncbi:MAG: GNAT family N-acetyltransferase [Cellulomonadaceae bacterium]|jgi:GNAT superfamily N-acetyltransferase|nr:GNAT family N-acetyltransferase [Cellulomonadaceae bacterium]
MTWEVLTATTDDVAEIATLTADAGAVASVGAGQEPVTREEMLHHLSIFRAAQGSILCAHHEGHLTGFIMTRTVGPYLFAESPGVVIDALYVDAEYRRQGVGVALIHAIAAAADEAGAPFVYGASSSSDRAMQRFLGQLGFAPVAGHRVVATAVLMQNLADDANPAIRAAAQRGKPAKMRSRSPLEELVARRRKAREVGLNTGALDLKALAEPDAVASNPAESNSVS